MARTDLLISRPHRVPFINEINEGAPRRFTVILREEAEGGYSVQCVELPGAISEGRTKKEALFNIKEAILGFLEAFPEESTRLDLKKEVIRVTV